MPSDDVVCLRGTAWLVCQACGNPKLGDAIGTMLDRTMDAWTVGKAVGASPCVEQPSV